MISVCAILISCSQLIAGGEINLEKWESVRWYVNHDFINHEFPLEELREAMNAEDVIIRSHAYYIWSSWSAQYYYWREKGGYEAPSPLPGFLQGEDQAVRDYFVENLRSDNKRFNFIDFTSYLRGNIEYAEPSLMAALRSTDSQQREWVVKTLMQVHFNERIPELDKAIIDNIEEYSGDREYPPVYHRPDDRNFSPSIEQTWITHHMHRLHDMLLEWLDGEDMGLRSVAAHAFAKWKVPEHAQRVVAILVQELKSDSKLGNASSAARALRVMDQLALRWLEGISAFHDMQQHVYIMLLIDEIRHPADSLADLQARRQMYPFVKWIDPRVNDPIIEYFGPEKYLPFVCAHENCYGNKGIIANHALSDLIWSACPCGNHGCDVKQQEMGSILQ